MTLREWIASFEGQFEQEQLDSTVIGANITIGLFDDITTNLEFHKLQFRTKENSKIGA